MKSLAEMLADEVKDVLDGYSAASVRSWVRSSSRELLRQDALIVDMAKALRVAVNQNEHDMLMTGEELRACLEALAKAEAQQ